MSDTRCTCVIVKAPTYDVYVQTPCGIHLRMVEDMKLQIDEWKKCGAALRDEMRERLAQEGLEMSDTPKSHYSPACNRLLELLRR